MRVLLLLLILVLSSCKAKKDNAESTQIPPPIVSCPEGGDCIFEVLQNSQLNLKRDDFGKLYPEITDGDKMVLRYEFKKDPIPDAEDSSHSELLFLELSEDTELIALEDENLQQVKMTYGRICFCRDAMGYFPVKKGHLFLSRSEKSLMLKVDFKVDKVPQILKEIEESLDFYPKN